MHSSAPRHLPHGALLLAFLAGPGPACGDKDADDSGTSSDGGGTSGDGGSAAPARTLGNGEHLLVHDGLDRLFRLYVPAGLPVGAPLVVAMDGYGGSAAGMQRYAGLDAVADREGFAVIYPQGMNDAYGYHYWEVGYAFHDGTVDDVGFIRAVVALVLEDHGLDAGAVFATGMSNGGDMSYRLACEADDLFLAVAPVAGCLMGVIQETCAPAGTPSLLEIHGTLDGITPWEGDPDGSDGYGPYLGTEDSVGHFVDLYGLDTLEEEALPDLSTEDRSTVLAHRWSAAGSKAEVWLYEIEGGHHDWPGDTGNQDIVAAEEIWAFFQRRLEGR